MRLALPLCSLLVLCSGCPEAPIKARILSLTFPQQGSPTAIALSASGREIQEAVKIIGDTLAADGFVPDPHPPEAAVHGFVASFSKFDPEGRVSRRPLVWFERDRLVVVFEEGRGGSHRLTADERKPIDLLQAQLISRSPAESLVSTHGLLWRAIRAGNRVVAGSVVLPVGLLQ